MNNHSSLSTYISIGILTIFCLSSLSAETNKDGLSFKYQYYTDNSDLIIQAPLFEVRKSWNKWLGLRTWGMWDAISAASRKGYNPPTEVDTIYEAIKQNGFDPDAISSASYNYATRLRDLKNDSWAKYQVATPENSLSVDAVSGATTSEIRKEAGLAWTFYDKLYDGNIHASMSREGDYKSTGAGAALVTHLADGATDISFSFQSFFDEYDFSRSARNLFESEDHRHVHQVDLGFTQSITPLTQAEFSLQSTLSQGFLARPYYIVLVEGTPYLEQIPDIKMTGALGLRLKQGVPTAIGLGSVGVAYHYYRDQWELSSNTLDVDVGQNIYDKFLLQMRYRYYVQGSAFFYRDIYEASALDGGSENRGYITTDSRLGPMDSHLIEGRVVWKLPSGNVQTSLPYIHLRQIDLSVGRYSHSVSKSSTIRRLHYEFWGDDPLTAWILRIGCDADF